jgi:hypothetical protein
MHSAEKREEYEAPRLESHGSIEAVTQGLTSGTTLDANFPTGTPASDLTFS